MLQEVKSSSAEAFQGIAVLEMDNRSILQGNDLAEQRSRRRLSSILKAPRSPLRDLGIGNELHQESTIGKRRKSSRRVSFAETIRVFTQELKSLGAGDAENEVFSTGDGPASSFRNENESTDSTECRITGMDRLLHGPLQAPAPQAEWDYTNCNKDQTILFSSDHDMDMTASNTVAIDGHVLEKPKKIDTSLFLASLKAPTSEESSNFDFRFSTAGQKLWDFQPPSTETKLKFSDFLACLGNESTTSSKIGVDKENYFPFGSKEELFSTKSTLSSQENTGNITCVFRDQEDGLDLTKCHTTNITSFLPTVNHQLTNLNSGNPLTSFSSTYKKQELHLLQEANVKIPKSVSNDQTVLCEDDMDMTLSHTTRIHGVLKESAPLDKTKTFVSCSNEKTIIFTDENEMELTKNDSIFFNSITKKGRPSVQRNCRAFCGDQSTVCPGEDMDMTRSHTVAIDAPAICEMFKDLTGDTVQPGKRQRSFGLLPFQMASSNSDSLENEQQGLATNQLNLVPLKSVRELGQNQPVLGNAEPKYGNENEKFKSSVSTANVPLASAEKTILFACEQDDMEMTKSYTIAIDSNVHGLRSNTCIPNPVLNDRRSHFKGLRLTSGFNNTVFFSGDSDDMDLTQSHTVRIDQKPLVRKLSNGIQNPILNATNQTRHLQESMDMTVVKHDGLQSKSSLAEADNKTVVFTCGQQDMDITQSHTVAIDGDAWCKEFPLDNCIGGNKAGNNTVFLSKKDSTNVAMQASVDDRMTSLSSCANPVLCGQLSDQVYKTMQDNTMVFPSDQDDMELTKSHTIAIDGKMQPVLDSTHRLNSILKDKKSNGRFRLSTIHNKTVLFSTDGDDMELTQSHTACIDQNNLTSGKQKRISNAVDRTTHVLDDMNMTMVETAGFQRDPTINESTINKTVVFTCDQPDMDITRSHTVAIAGDNLPKGFQSGKGLAINQRAELISAVPRCLPHNNLLLESKQDSGSVDKMDSVKEDTLVQLGKPEFRLSDSCMNITNMPCQKLTGQLQSTLEGNPVVFLPNQDSMDMTCASTVTIKRILLPCESANNKTTTHAPCPDKTIVLEDDMEYTKSHTAVIDGINTNELPSQSISLKSMAFSADDMDITKSNTVFIDSVVTDERTKNDRQHKSKNTFIKLSGPCNRIPDDLKMTTVYTRELLNDEAKDFEKVATMSVLPKDNIFSSLDQEDMDLTRANTIAIENKVCGEVGRLQATDLSKTQNRYAYNLAPCYKNIPIDNKVQHCAPPGDTAEADMDITKSNTVYIDHIPARQMPTHSMIESKDVLFSQKLTGLHNETKPVAGHTKLKDLNGGDLAKNRRAQANENFCLLTEALENRLLSCCKDTYTVQAENNMPGDMVKSKNSDPRLTLSNDDKSTVAVSNKLMDISDCKIRHAVATSEENPVELPSELHFVNNMPCQVKLDLSSTNNVLIGTSKRETIFSHQKSFCTFDETVHQVCSMEETNIDPVINNNGKYPSNCFFDQTLCNQGEMDITKCHTTEIEGKIKGTSPSLCPEECDAPVHKARTLFSEDMSVKLTGSIDAEMVKNDKAIFTRNQKIHQGHINECEQTMEIIKAQTAAVKVNNIEENCSENSNEGNPAKSGSIQVLKLGDMSNILPGTSQNWESISKQSIDRTEKKGSKHTDFSISLLGKTVMFSGDLGEMELTQIGTMTVPDLSEQGRKTTTAGVDKTCLFLETEMDITKSNTVYIDRESKEVEFATFRKENKRPSSLVSLISDNYEGTVSDHKDANAEVDLASDDKYITLNGNELIEHKAPSVDTETIPLGVLTACDHKPINDFLPICDLSVPSEPSDNCASREHKTVAEYICSQQSEACAKPKNPGEVEGYQVSKKNRLSKRVSFCIHEKDSRVGESDVQPNTDIILQNREKLFVSNNHSDGSQFKSGNINEPTGDIFAKFDFTNKVLIGCSSENNQHLNNSVAEKTVVLSSDKLGSEVANNAQQDVSLIKFSQKEKNRRRSIADIHLKIRRLTEKSKNQPSNHTAPVSCLSNELSTLPQTPNPTSGDCIPKQTLLNEQVSIQTNEIEPKGKATGTTKEMSLQNRLSVNMLQPKLPSKRHSSTCNLQESVPFTISKPSTQTSQTSVSVLKAFADRYEGQCIDEEMLPGCPDDHDGNGLFQYEVPDGAWEELCVKEAMHKNLNDCSLDRETVHSHKRARDHEDDAQFHREKRVRRKDDTQNTQISVGFKSLDECSRSEHSSHHTSKTMEQTYCSSSSQDSRESMSVELSSQQYSQMDSQLPWDNGCGQNVWQKFQDGTITVKEFFMLLRIRILIQKPRYSELPVNRGNYETLSPTDLMLDLFIYQPKLQVYEEECHTLYQTTEELKLYTDMQEKPLIEVSSLLWEAMRMCTEKELVCFGITLKNLKSIYSKKSRILAHEAKVSIYSKLLHKAQVQVEAVQTRISETAKLLEEIDDCVSSLHIETAKLEEDFKNNLANISGGKEIQCELENLISQEKNGIRERSHLEERKENVLKHLGCLQDKARGLDKRLQEPCFAEWEMVKWTETKATFVFLYDSLELDIMFGDEIDGEKFINQPCRRISRVILMSQLNEETAPPSSLLVHRLILQFIEKKGYLHETSKMQKDVPQFLFDVSLVVSRCKQFGEEVEYLMKWGAKYNILKTQVESNEVKLLFSSSAAFAKFELSVQISEMYPTVPLSFTLLNRIGNTEYSRVAAVIAKVPVGLWLLKRAVRSIHEHLLV